MYLKEASYMYMYIKAHIIHTGGPVAQLHVHICTCIHVHVSVAGGVK